MTATATVLSPEPSSATRISAESWCAAEVAGDAAQHVADALLVIEGAHDEGHVTVGRRRAQHLRCGLSTHGSFEGNPVSRLRERFQSAAPPSTNRAAARARGKHATSLRAARHRRAIARALPERCVEKSDRIVEQLGQAARARGDDRQTGGERFQRHRRCAVDARRDARAHRRRRRSPSLSAPRTWPKKRTRLPAARLRATRAPVRRRRRAASRRRAARRSRDRRPCRRSNGRRTRPRSRRRRDARAPPCAPSPSSPPRWVPRRWPSAPRARARRRPAARRRRRRGRRVAPVAAPAPSVAGRSRPCRAASGR